MVKGPGRQAGFTYLGLIIFVTIIGMVGAATLKVDALLARAAAEEELLAIGAAFGAALDSYAAATPQGASPYPPSLRELLKDPRSPAVRRHLRRIFVDPLTGRAEWGIAYLGGGDTGVVAVYSLSDKKPLKVANFDRRFKGLDNKEKISEWRFGASEESLAPAVVPTASGGPQATPAGQPVVPSPVAPAPAPPEPALELTLPPEPPPQPEPVPAPETAPEQEQQQQEQEQEQAPPAEPPADPAPPARDDER